MTAYEMRISDWSSDVCSSDLEAHQASPHPSQAPNGVRIVDSIDRDPVSRAGIEVGQAMDRPHRPFETLETGSELSQRFFAVLRIDDEMTGLRLRSEEHTSELQSLMRISYAVFCLKKKTQTNTTTTVN